MPQQAPQKPIADNKALVTTRPEAASPSLFGRLLGLFRLRPVTTLRDDLTFALETDAFAEGGFSVGERAMLANILRLRERRVEDVMVPRAEIHAVERHTNLEDVLRMFEETGHSRLPVYDDNLDDPRGMVLIKDLLLYMTAKATHKNGTRSLDLSRVDLAARLKDADIARRVLFVPPSMLASDLMARMQATRTQMALVIDEYGGTDGLVTLEDIVEEVVGEIEDEHDDEDGTEPQIKADGDGLWTVDARMPLEKVSEALGDAFVPGDHGDDVDTLGGLVFALAGTVPVRGEVVTGVPGYEFRVLEADPRRIRRMRIVQTNLRDKRRKVAAAAGASAGADKTAQ